MAYLPPEHAVVGNDLAVMYMNELYPVKVAVAGSTPLFDPDRPADEELRVLVCVKRVPAPGARIVLTDDQKAVDARHLPFTVSPHEECAVEEAVRLKEKHEGTCHRDDPGPRRGRGTAAVRSVGRRGRGSAPDDGRLRLGPTGDGGRDSRSEPPSSKPSGGAFDLILFGNESADSAGYQVGIRVAHALGRPVISGIKGIEIEDDTVVARRETGAGFEVYRLPLPAVVAVKEGINLPRYPTLPGPAQGQEGRGRDHPNAAAGRRGTDG